MKKLGLCLLLACFVSAMAFASDNNTKDKDSTRTITGCLQQTSHANQYLLKANDGSSWKISSDTVQLASHVGHTISATGVVSNATAHNMKEDMKDMAHDSGVKKSNNEHGSMKVTNVEMVSSSCSQ